MPEELIYGTAIFFLSLCVSKYRIKLNNQPLLKKKSSKIALPYLLKSKNPHILNLSPPLNLNPKWFKNNLGITFFESICVVAGWQYIKIIEILKRTRLQSMV